MQPTKQKFTPHTFAVFRHVCTLNESERQMLDRNFMLKTTGLHLHSLLNCEHAWKDILINNGVDYELVYQECCNAMLDTTLAHFPLLLNFRYNSYNRMAVCLVKQPFSNADLSFYKEL